MLRPPERKQYDSALEQIKKEFSQQDPFFMADCSGARFKNELFELTYCSNPIQVLYPQAQIRTREKKLTCEEKILVLQYLTWSKGLPSRGRWLSFWELKGGPHHWVPFQKEILIPLAQAYGKRPANLCKRIEQGQGQLTTKGDASGIVPIFIRLPLYYILWGPTEEHPPRCSILFEETAESYLPTASLYVMAIAATKRLFLKEGNQQI